MNINQITMYLHQFKGTELRSNILDELSKLKSIAVNQGDQEEAKNIWCLEQIYKVKNHFLSVYKNLVDKEFFQAWCELERADIELHFLRMHLDYTGNKYNLDHIEKNLNQLPKLFPYKYFSSRESIVKNWTCSICNNVITLRNSCNHEVGEIYNGEQCCRIAGDIEFQAVAIVTDPFDKYGVLFPEGLEYNYAILENLMQNWTSPWEKWEYQISRDLIAEYNGLGRNNLCLCNSGIKYKNCCLKTGKNLHDHFKFLFHDKDPKDITNHAKQTFNSWKN